MDREVVDLGPSEDLEAKSNLVDADWNFVLVHRTDSPALSWWGNRCGSVMRRIILRADSNKPIHWYHVKIYHYVCDQYDKYGDYYRILDNSFGNPLDDVIYEETNG